MYIVFCIQFLYTSPHPFYSTLVFYGFSYIWLVYCIQFLYLNIYIHYASTLVFFGIYTYLYTVYCIQFIYISTPTLFYTSNLSTYHILYTIYIPKHMLSPSYTHIYQFLYQLEHIPELISIPFFYTYITFYMPFYAFLHLNPYTSIPYYLYPL